MIWFAIAIAVLAAWRGMWSPCGLSVLTSLNPMSERSRGHRFAITAAWYVAGAVAGGAVLGGLCSAGAWALSLFAPTESVRVALSAAAALIGFASDAKLSAWSLPEHPRQLNDRWLSAYRRWIYAGGFGAQIGFGFATYIMTAAVYVTAALAVLTASPLAAMAACLAFAVVRGLSILAAADLTTSERLARRARLLDRSSGLSLGVVTCGEASLAVALLWAWSPVLGALAALPTAGCLPAVRGRLTSRLRSRSRASALSE